MRGELLAVAVTDHLNDGLSAVYTFFRPGRAQARSGCVLDSVADRRSARPGLQWVYLGYLIEQTPKMSYKDRYQPQQRLIQGQWVETLPESPSLIAVRILAQYARAAHNTH